MPKEYDKIYSNQFYLSKLNVRYHRKVCKVLNNAGPRLYQSMKKHTEFFIKVSVKMPEGKKT